MEPYNIEIFDRDLNFKYATVIDADSLVYVEDFMDPEKNTISVPQDFIPADLAPGDSNAPKGWYIRIKNSSNEIQGVISGYESGETQTYITYAQMITVLNLQMLVATAGVTLTTVEAYIKSLIEQYFMTSSDYTQRITGLSQVTATSQTSGTFDYCNDDEEQVIIDFLDDLVYPAFELYGIVTNVSFNPQAKTVSINIGKNSTTAKTIEADLPNVTQKSFTIRRSNKEVNKVSVIDTDNGDEHVFYLHPDGSFDQNNMDRIEPVVNSIVTVKGQTLATNAVNAKYKNYIDIISGLSEYEGTLSNDEFNSLKNAVNVMAPLYISGHPLEAPTIRTTTPGATTSASIGGTSYRSSQPVISQVNSGGVWGSTFQVETTPGVGHAILYGTVTTYVEVGSAINVAQFEYQKYFTTSMANTAFRDYKNTQAYQNEIAQVYATVVLENAIQQAVKVFAKNKYNNLIELTSLSDDSMVDPKDMQIGQEVQIIHDGVAYTSMLSGKEYRSGQIKLEFGTIRLELTSWLKGRY